MYYFLGEYICTVQNQTLRDKDDYAVPFLALPEVQAVPIWRELYEIGESMTNWVRTQRAWKRPRKLGRLLLRGLVDELHRHARD